MSNDFFFRMGSLHTICQDYALSGTKDGRQYALISDGCSGQPDPNTPGSPFTDFGSRFLVRSTCRYLSEIQASSTITLKETFPAIKVTADAMAMARQAMLGNTALDATLVGIIQDGDAIGAFRCGDGVIAVRYRDGRIYYSTVKYGNNMPNYLRYQLEPKQSAQYISEAKTVQYLDNYRTEQGEWGISTTSTIPLDVAAPIDALSFRREDIDLAIIFSDGVESFQTPDNQPVSIEKVLDQVFALKGFAGRFITRRCGMFLERFCVENKWKHTDDLSVAGLYLGELV